MVELVSNLNSTATVSLNGSLNLPSWIETLVGLDSNPELEAVGGGLEIGVAHGDGFSLVLCRLANARHMPATLFQERVTAAYGRVAEAVGASEARHAVRLWNFIPGILEPFGGLDHRYMVFNAARFDAYNRLFGGPHFYSAIATASGVGAPGDDFCLGCLSSTRRGRPVENPRQIAAYKYSKRWGPRPPCFARATIIERGDRKWLLVGGTASVLGEDSVHTESLLDQTEETFENLASIVAASLGQPSSRKLLNGYRHLRLYLPDAGDQVQVERMISNEFAGLQRLEIQEAVLCRGELMVEIEGLVELDPLALELDGMNGQAATTDGAS